MTTKTRKGRPQCGILPLPSLPPPETPVFSAPFSPRPLHAYASAVLRCRRPRRHPRPTSFRCLVATPLAPTSSISGEFSAEKRTSPASSRRELLVGTRQRIELPTRHAEQYGFLWSRALFAVGLADASALSKLNRWRLLKLIKIK